METGQDQQEIKAQDGDGCTVHGSTGSGAATVLAIVEIAQIFFPPLATVENATRGVRVQ